MKVPLSLFIFEKFNFCIVISLATTFRDGPVNANVLLRMPAVNSTKMHLSSRYCL